MPEPLSERTLADLVLLGIGSSLSKREGFQYVSATRLMKMAYSCAEALDLPITRGWYQYGWFIYDAPVSKDRLLALAGRTLTNDESIAECQRLIQVRGPVSSLYQRIYRCAEEVVRKFAFHATDDIVRNLYREEAPEPFNRLYLANWDLLDLTRKITEDRGQQRIAGSLWADYSKAVTELHVALANFPDAAVRGLLSEYSSLLELLVIKAEFAPPERRDDFWKFLNDAAETYRHRAWRFAASFIFRETVLGPSAEEARRAMDAYLNSLPRFAHDVERLWREAKMNGFLPSSEELDSVVGQAREKLGSRAAEAISQLLTIGGVEGERSGHSA